MKKLCVWVVILILCFSILVYEAQHKINKTTANKPASEAIAGTNYDNYLTFSNEYETSAANTATTHTEKTTIKQESDEQYDSSSETVYVTDFGSKYHLYGCRYLKSKHAISKRDAKQQGYEPCEVCQPGR